MAMQRNINGIRNGRRMALAMMLPAIAAILDPMEASAQEVPLPRIVASQGRHALIVDDKPYLMLGAQVHNSSNYEAMLPKVWPVVRQLHANTVEVPVAWEQVEAEEGKFDFSFVDALVKQARDNEVRLVILWFGTWKNSGPSYTPEWVKQDGARFPRMKTREGRTSFVLSPHGVQTLAADKRAFVALMSHLSRIDPQHTVIMVQPENEVGALGTPRDFSLQAQRLFNDSVPEALVRALKVKPGNWTQVFGAKADQAFNAWYTAAYINELARAGKAVLNLPMYCNAALSNPFSEEGANTIASGGPNWNVIDIWKVAAPDIDLVAPDIYNRDHDIYLKYLDHYTRKDNALFVPETGNALDFARFFWPVLGKGGIGFSPFGMDGTSFSNFPLGAKKLDAETIEAFAGPYELFNAISRDWAGIALKHPTWGVAKNTAGTDQSSVLGRWKITAQFGLWQMKERDDPRNVPHPNAERPVGGAVVAQLGKDEFLIAGTSVRMRITEADKGNSEFLSVEEGTFVDGRWIMRRRWNGDQIDFGLNLVEPTLLRVRMHTYR